MPTKKKASPSDYAQNAARIYGGEPEDHELPEPTKLRNQVVTHAPVEEADGAAEGADAE